MTEHKEQEARLGFMIRPYKPRDETMVVELWRMVFPDSPPHNNPVRDIDLKLDVQPELFLVVELEGSIIGTAMAGYDGHRGWVYYVAVHPDHRRQGIGTHLMRVVEAGLITLDCPKVNLQIRAENHAVRAFYESLGYGVEQRISMGKRLGGVAAEGS